jgi:hypothetical protein
VIRRNKIKEKKIAQKNLPKNKFRGLISSNSTFTTLNHE